MSELVCRSSASRNSRWCVLLLITLLGLALPATGLAQEKSDEKSETTTEVVAGTGSGWGNATVMQDEYMYWGILLAGSLLALTFAGIFYTQMKAADEGNEKMVEIATHVREGASAYLRQQNMVVLVYFIIVCGLLFWARAAGIQQYWVPIAFLTGGFWSGLAGFIGMKTATAASSRTAAGAMKSLNDGLQVAFRSGAVMGLTVVGLGTLDMSFWYAFLRFFCNLDLNTITVTMLCSLMGASSQALFARVGGGIFTKAADVGADLVGKVEQGIPEDDPRNPATIADNVGDNVGDVAGMGADLYESYCGSILATAALGVAGMTAATVPADADIEMFKIKALFLPMVVAAIGIVMSIVLYPSGSRGSGRQPKSTVEGAGSRYRCLNGVDIDFGDGSYLLDPGPGVHWFCRKYPRRVGRRLGYRKVDRIRDER